VHGSCIHMMHAFYIHQAMSMASVPCIVFLLAFFPCSVMSGTLPGRSTFTTLYT
jgi:hypothetical protein